ncbi:MAG: hypothetical protein ABII12_18455 [Planctomycetota bacterium]
MRNAALYAKKVRQLFTRLKKAGDKATFVQPDTVTEYLLLAILSNYGSETRAASAVAKLQSTFVDYNDLRVTPIAEIVEAIGVDFPRCRKAAEEISAALHAVFNQLHHLNLDFLKVGSRRTAEAFINALGGILPHTRAMVIARCLGGHAVPLDEHMYAHLIKSGCIPETTTVEDAQKFLAGRIRERDAETFYGLFKRFAATHAPRKMPTGKTPVRQAEHEPAAKAKAKSKAKPATKPKTKPKSKKAPKPKVSEKGKAVSKREKPAGKKTKPAKKVTPRKTVAKKPAAKPTKQ